MPTHTRPDHDNSAGQQEEPRGVTRIRVSLKSNSLRVEDYPGAGNVIDLKGGQATRIAAMAWHRTDLSFAQQCLELVAFIDPPDRDSVEAEAFWRAAQMHYFKCFGTSKGRAQLDAPRIFRPGSELLEAHRRFLRIRNEHLMHDEGTHTSSHVGAVIAPLGQRPKLMKVVVVNMDTITLTPENLATLRHLVDTAHEWAVADFSLLVDGIGATIDTQAHADLLRVRDARMRFAWEKDKR